jgi:tetratricopeptide (TPR) repeat protein
VRGATRRHPGDPILLTALGDLFRQTEDHRSAINTYGAALTADPDFADARLGRAISQIRLGAGDNAAESLDEAQALSEAQHLGTAFDARLLAARGRIHFMADRLTAAREAATHAIELDPKCSTAHLLLADIAAARSEPTAEHLRSALAGREALPEIVGRLAIAADEAAEMCAMSRRYLRVDPGGRWAERMRNNVRRCR